ncbi:MAG TPA: NUDIX hydrolase [Methanomassiliicoccales archaeon]|nr:NUDIX hydrolase [Methanomassiliicoccales archaeon]
MNWVYSVIFLDKRFVMVYNPKRKGWEMPGGRIEPGESADDAAVREAREECGCAFVPVAHKKHRDGAVFAGELGCPFAKSEMDWALFSELPSELAFPEEEYGPIIEWARKAVEKSRLERRRAKFVYD